MIRKLLLLCLVFALPFVFLVATPVFASQIEGFDPFFLLMDYDFMIIGLLLGAGIITLSYLFTKKHMEEG
ncbi:hypothetical protein U0355_03855 [Salimicrobium sp. PL1-032A]|uniref:hypothetical protein n=1 Tax=Salimicrobium sp. PL1-032A TaxID=3095364 RepID=UPI0032609295